MRKKKVIPPEHICSACGRPFALHGLDELADCRAKRQAIREAQLRDLDASEAQS